MNNAKLAPSAAQRKIFEETGIDSVEALIYADLRGAGWNTTDAFYAAYHNLYGMFPLKDQKRVVDNLEKSEIIKRRMEAVRQDTKQQNGEETISLRDLARETSKEKILSDLVLARKRTKEGTKEWTDLTKAIADYAKIKQDDIKTDEQPIRYYLPLKYPRNCAECVIFQKKQADKLAASKK